MAGFLLAFAFLDGLHGHSYRQVGGTEYAYLCGCTLPQLHICSLCIGRELVCISCVLDPTFGTDVHIVLRVWG